jgi:hypothetical protein
MNSADRLRGLAISDSGFLFDPITGMTFTVNETGRAILDLLKQGLAPEAIRDELGQRFETTGAEDLDGDVREFLWMLREQGILPRDEEA